MLNGVAPSSPSRIGAPLQPKPKLLVGTLPRRTIPELVHRACLLWCEAVRTERSRPRFTTHVRIRVSKTCTRILDDAVSDTIIGVTGGDHCL